MELNNIAGNVREWVTNPQGKKSRFSILEVHILTMSTVLMIIIACHHLIEVLAMDFAVVQSLNEVLADTLDNFVIDYAERDILKEKDVSDDVFKYIKNNSIMINMN